MYSTNKVESDSSKYKHQPDDQSSITEYTGDKSIEESLPSSHPEETDDSLICRSKFLQIHQESSEQLLHTTTPHSHLSSTVEGSFTEPARTAYCDHKFKPYIQLLRLPYSNNVVNLKRERQNAVFSKDHKSDDQQKSLEEHTGASQDCKYGFSETNWKPTFEPGTGTKAKLLISETASKKNVYKKQQRLAENHQKETMLASSTGSVGIFVPQQIFNSTISIFSYVKDQCLLQTGLLQYKPGNQDLGSCCHLGNGYVVTCFHSIVQNGSILVKENMQVIFQDCGAQLTVYDINKVIHYNSQYDIVFLLLETNRKPLPPSFKYFERREVRNKELPVFIGGYQQSVNKTYGEFVLDQTVKLQKPSDKEITEEESILVQKYGDNFSGSYSKLRRPEIECVKSRLIQGASGGPIVFLDKDNNVVLLMLYQQGHPEQYYKLHIEKRKEFESRHLVQTGILMRDVINDMPKILKEELKLSF